MTDLDEEGPVPKSLEEEIKKLEKMERAFKLLVRLQELNQDIVDLSSHVDYVTKLSRLNITESVTKFAALRNIASRHLEQFLALLLFSVDSSEKPLEQMTEEEMAASLRLMVPITNKHVPVISFDLFKTEFEKLEITRQKKPLPLEPVYAETGQPIISESFRLEIEKRFEEQFRKFRASLIGYFHEENTVPANLIIGQGTKEERIGRLLSLLYCLQNGLLEMAYRAGVLVISISDDGKDRMVQGI
ncbi:MAG: hypothetical protein ACFFD4_06995 [Candidatus Odinarchaeota archaeon]